MECVKKACRNRKLNYEIKMILGMKKKFMYGLLFYSTNLSKSDASDCRDLIFGDMSNCAFQRMGMNALYESLPEGIIWGEENWGLIDIQVR